MTEWFKVKDKLPPDYDPVLFWDKSYRLPIAAHYDRHSNEWFSESDEITSFEIDKESAIWCHMPELPEWAKK